MQIIATSGTERSTYDVEIDMTNPNPVTYAFNDVIFAPNSSKTISWNTFGVAGTNGAKLEVSSMPTIDFNRRLQYLIEYPHGCVEQTTSSAFPQLFLADVADIDCLHRINHAEKCDGGNQSTGRFSIARRRIVYWPRNTVADDWGTSYAGHFMIEAEKKGYVLPVSFKSKWFGYQQREARSWRLMPQYGNDFRKPIVCIRWLWPVRRICRL